MKQPIDGNGEFVVARHGLLYHGLLMDPAEFPEYRYGKDEEILIIECFSKLGPEYNKPLLDVIHFKSKKAEKKYLPNVMIYPPIPMQEESNDLK